MKRNLKTMLKVLLLTLLLSMSMTTVTEAKVARPKVVYSKGVKCYKKKQYKKAEKYFAKLAKKAHEVSVKKMNSSVKSAYLQMLNTFVSNYGLGNSEKLTLHGYYLTDIDKDKIPEIIFNVKSSEAESYGHVYAYRNGTAEYIGTFGFGHSSPYYDPSGNGMTLVYGNMGFESVSTVRITPNGVVSEKWGDYRTLGADDYMNFPYALDDHMDYRSGTYVLDYSPLR